MTDRRPAAKFVAEPVELGEGIAELLPAPGYPGALCADLGERSIAAFVWAGGSATAT